MNNNKSDQALTAFVTVQFVNISALFADYLIMKAGLPPITTISIKYPVIGASILLFQCISPVSLAIHFWYAAHPSSRI
jgi:hypothetical protein